MDKAPAFQYYPKDLLSSQKVSVMSAEEFGANWLLASHAWLSEPPGTLPNDDRLLSKLARVTEEFFREHKDVIMSPFRLRDDNTWEHPRLLLELKKQQERRAECRLAGLKSGESRRTAVEQALNASSTSVEPGSNSSAPSPFASSAPSSSANTNCPLPNLPANELEFQKLWEQYPRKEGKGEAVQYFRKSIRSDQDLKDIQAALKNYLANLQVQKTELKYTKTGASWFKNGWRDWVDYKGAMASEIAVRPTEPPPTRKSIDNELSDEERAEITAMLKKTKAELRKVRRVSDE